MKPIDKLSKNFRWSEVYATSHLTLLETNRTEAEEKKGTLAHLFQYLMQPIRKDIGLPLRISSSFRGETLNAKVKGQQKSQHVKAEAVDFMFSDAGLHTDEWHQRLFMRTAAVLKSNQLMFGQLLYETQDSAIKDRPKRWIHLSLGWPYRPLEKCRQIFSVHNHKRSSEVKYCGVDLWR